MNKASVSAGNGFFGLLFIIFFLLKLGVGNTAVVTWSWWWVTAPLWGPVAFVLAIFLIGIIVYGFFKLLTRT